MSSLVGFVGRIGSGKTLSADHLCAKYGYVKVKFASPLKDMLRAVGLEDRHIEGDLKEVPCDLLCGQTPRWAMQTLGTEWGRSLIGESLWGNLWQKRVVTLLNMNTNVVVDDIRFTNELERVQLLNGRVIGLRRNEHLDADHSSEAEIKLDECDLVLDNQDWHPEKLMNVISSSMNSWESPSSS